MSRFTVETGVPVTMRDGILLATDIYRPAVGQVPALVTRTPYDKDRVAGFSDDLDLFRALRAGYGVVVQDVRGRNASEGAFDAFAQEPADGADLIAWVAAQSWCTGAVGTFGKSYLGAIQWLAAPQQPPALRAMAPSMTPADIYEGNIYQGGAHVLHVLRWAVGLGSTEAARRAARGEPIPPEWQRDFDSDAAIAHLPLADHPAFDHVAPFWPNWVRREADGPYWRSLSPRDRHHEVQVPSLNIGGWYDILLGPVLDNFVGVRRHGQGSARQSRLVVGPWSHVDLTGIFPERDFGIRASREAIDLDGIQLRWFDRWVKDLRNGADDEAPVMIFVMGADEWLQANDWPLPSTRVTSYHLHSGGAANTRHGDGTLSLTAAEAEPPDTFVDDPHSPVPTVGGQILQRGAHAIGPRGQQTVEDRHDVLVYATHASTEPVTVIGPVELIVHMSSTAPDTDLTAKLVDVFPDGRRINLTDGIQRVRYRRSPDTPELMVPGVIYEVRVNLWATANVFLPGHRIGLEIAGTNFPRFSRNSHTGGDIATEPGSAYTAARTTIYHDLRHPSRLLLPLQR